MTEINATTTTNVVYTTKVDAQALLAPTVIPEAIERMADERYKVVPSHESMFHRWAVVAGGTQQLYLGREVECQNMSRKFAGAFLDGVYVALRNAAPQPSPTAPATQQPEGDVVAYLDVGANGYLDLGSELSEDALQQLPKGRHALVIAGTYGIDGYVAAPQPSYTAQAADSAQKDAMRYRWLREGNNVQHGAAWHVAVNLYGFEWDAAIDAARAAQETLSQGKQ